jgi:hypothetical protein
MGCPTFRIPMETGEIPHCLHNKISALSALLLHLFRISFAAIGDRQSEISMQLVATRTSLQLKNNVRESLVLEMSQKKRIS